MSHSGVMFPDVGAAVEERSERGRSAPPLKRGTAGARTSSTAWRGQILVVGPEVAIEVQGLDSTALLIHVEKVVSSLSRVAAVGAGGGQGSEAKVGAVLGLRWGEVAGLRVGRL